MKFGFSQWGRPTPENIKKIADTILYSSPFITAWILSLPLHGERAEEYKAWIVASVNGVVVGIKALSKFTGTSLSENNQD